MDGVGLRFVWRVVGDVLAVELYQLLDFGVGVDVAVGEVWDGYQQCLDELENSHCAC